MRGLLLLLIKVLSVRVVLLEYVNLHLVLLHLPTLLKRAVLLKEHDEAEPVDNKELLLLLGELLLLLQLLLAHPLGLRLDLLDPLLDLDELLQLPVVLAHQLVRALFLLAKKDLPPLDKTSALPLLVRHALVPGVQGIVGDEAPASLEVFDLVHFLTYFVHSSHIRLDMHNLPLLVN